MLTGTRPDGHPVLAPEAVLVLIDVQDGFDSPHWGHRVRPEAEERMAELARAWVAHGRRIVVVRHDSEEPDSPLRPGTPGNALRGFLRDVDPALLVSKSVNSSFHGTPDLDAWLREQGSPQIVLAGLSTNHCVETTARVGGNLGHDVLVALDATASFGVTPAVPAGLEDHFAGGMRGEDLMRATAVNLVSAGFARVTSTAALLAQLLGAARPDDGVRK